MGTRWLGVVGAVVAGVWIVGVTAAAQSGGWLVEQYALIEQNPLPAWAWGALGAANGVLVALPALVVRVAARRDGLRAAGTAWLLAAAALVALTPLRAVPDAQPALGHAATAATCGLLTAALRAVRRRRRRPWAGAGAVPAAVGAGVVALVPWLAVGAFGDPLELATGVLAAAGLGALAGTVLSGRFWAPLSGRILAGGASAAVTLVVLCAGAGQGGAQLALLGGVPVLGLAVAAAGGSGRAVGAAVGTAAAGPLTLVAPAQLSLLLGTRDVAWYALLATAATLALGLAVGAGYAARAVLRRRDPVRRNGSRFGWAAAAVALAAAVAVYPAAGHPGLYGNRLLVVLRAQADLTRIAATTGPAGRAARATAVYRALVDTARRSQAPLRRALAERGIGFRPYYLVDAVEVDAAGPELRQWLTARPDVDRVLLCPRLRPIPRRPAPTGGSEPAPQTPLWNVSLIGADRVVRDLGVDGRGITVGGSDTGVDATHPALRGGFRGGPSSWYDPWYGSRTPVDYNGHGTHTLASAVGRASGDAQVGVAPGARWVGCVDLARDMGNPARYLDCLQFMLAPFPYGGDPFTDGDPALGPEVLTNSWDCPPTEGCDAATFAPAARALAAAGVYVVAAAGNAGPRCGSAGDPPGSYPDVLQVGAVDGEGRVADFSGRGPVPGGDGKPDLVAPGVRVLSAAPGDGWRYLSGTSMSAPQVAGVVALMWSANPRLVGDVPATTRILTDTATRVPAAAEPPAWRLTGVPDCGPGTAAGAGLVDAYRAVLAARASR